MTMLFKQKIEAINLEHKNAGGVEPQFTFSFVGESSKKAELELQTKMLLMLMNIDTMRIF